MWLKALGHSYADAAGNETRVQRAEPLLVDNAAPAAPVSLTSPQATANINNFSVSWSLPADAGAPIDKARYQLCQDGACGATQIAPSLTGLDNITLPKAGAATLRVWLEDSVGHASPDSAATIRLTYAPPPMFTPPPECSCVPGGPPTKPPTTPPAQPRKTSPALKLTTLRRVGRRVTVAGSLSSKASGRVTLRYRVKIHGRSHTLTKRVSIARHAFRTTLTLSRSYAAQRSATVSVAYAGDADTTAQTRTATLRTRA
jgi:hypothetical protein